MYKLLSATPSPYARKVRIALLEKAIAFELITQVPWDKITTTPEHNPLEKLPVLIMPNGDSVYESSFIIQYLEIKHPEKSLYPKNPDDFLLAKRIEVLCDGICDATVLSFFELMRGACSSAEWLSRQRRKIEGGVKEMAKLTQHSSTFVVGDTFSLGDIALGTALGYLKVRLAEFDWQSLYPALAKRSQILEQRDSFASTKPYPQTITDKVV